MSSPNNQLDRRIIKSKDALHDALLHLMQQKEFKEISITDIVKQANLNRGTFYKHYQYKEDLLEEIIDDVISDLIFSYREPYQNMEHFSISNLTSAAIKVFDHVYNHSNFYELIVKNNKFSGGQTKICTALKNLVLENSEEHQPNTEINRDLQASYVAYAIFGMIVEWINHDFTYSPSYMAEQLLAMIKQTD
ncbi:TetR/AcrR family transcriptional regulator [Paenibacillus sp. Marseille-Q4541]|uniref:TetR/AcrR family transcriptional regulator n=1 Tax=Paenibacillus sp. Marseille-Q4541 TaxID=2831522 RepID=UPI001BA524F0|nr:TetR/AcrR family transcriptional regulator [Paenibacillus sp. Marseille-Q4541]